MKTQKTVRMAETAILAAIIILMAFTPIGYLRLPGLEITFITIPVIIGAIVVGPAAGAVLGAIFGLTSFIQCFMGSVLGTAMIAISPFLTFIVCFVPRLLMGYLTGVIFKLFKKKNIASFIVTSLSGALLNTVLFMTALMIFFGNAPIILEFKEALGAQNVFIFVVLFVGINGLIEAVSCGVIGTIVSKVLYNVNKKQLS